MVLRVSPAESSEYKTKEVALAGYGFNGTLGVALTKTAEVTVTVTDKVGNTGIAGARVQFRRADGALFPVSKTDDQGEVTYTCNEGDQMELGDHQTVLVSADGYVAAEQAFVAEKKTALKVQLVKAENIPYEIEAKDSGNAPLSGANVYVGNADLEYRLLGTTGENGKVNGTLAAAERFFVRGESFHLKVEYDKDVTPITEFVSLNTSNKELLVPDDGDVVHSIKLKGKGATQLRMNFYSYSIADNKLTRTPLSIGSYTSTPSISATKLATGLLVTLNKNVSYTFNIVIDNSNCYYNGNYV